MTETNYAYDAVSAYLGDTSWTAGEIDAAIQAEWTAQAAVIRPDSSPDQGYPDLLEALCRRVARNLAVRALPLGFQTSVADAAIATTRIGADPEIRRLEAPYRRLMVG